MLLVRPGADGGQSVLQAHAMLVQGGFGAGAGGNGESGVHVFHAGAVVPGHDVHIVTALLQNDLHDALGLVGAEKCIQLYLRRYSKCVYMCHE